MMILEDIAHQFCFQGDYLQAEPTGQGHINDTFAVTFKQKDGEVRRYILQKINRTVFKNPEGLMRNIEQVTIYLRRNIERVGGNPDRETLTLVPTIDETAYFRDPEGDYWRGYLFIEGACTYEIAQSQNQIYQAAQAFGRFLCLLADFPVTLLEETIPGFHDTPMRFKAFSEAVQHDPANRAQSVSEEIRFIEQHEADTHLIAGFLEKGQNSPQGDTQRYQIQ